MSETPTLVRRLLWIGAVVVIIMAAVNVVVMLNSNFDDWWIAVALLNAGVTCLLLAVISSRERAKSVEGNRGWRRS